jgi:hypothetical protein
VAAVVRALCRAERQGALRALDTARLASLLREVARHGGAARIEDPEYRAALGLGRSACRASEAWQRLAAGTADLLAAPERAALAAILEEGCLATRILRRAGEGPSRSALRAVYAELCDCLRENRMFRAA